MPVERVIPRTPEFYAWREQNPLRRWRKQHGITEEHFDRVFFNQRDARTRRMWEDGFHIPNEFNMRRLGVLLGESVDGEWRDWYSRNPNELEE